MPPDLNSVPSSLLPGSSSPQTSRRASQQLPSGTGSSLSTPSLNILPSNQSAVNQASQPPMMSTHVPSNASAGGDNTGVGAGPGPLRHPRPLTAADLHLQLEKEQEAVVNRLTRELSMLRAAQNASVVSNASSTSASFPDTTDHNANHLLSGPNQPAPSQRARHRSSSSTSIRSIPGGSTPSTSTVGGITSSVGTGVAPVSITDRTRGSMSRHEPVPPSLSRQNSVSSSRRSGASSPAPSSAHGSYHHPESLGSLYNQQRPSLAQYREPSTGSYPSYNGNNASDTLRTETAITSVQTTGRYEETAYHRNELESVKRENEALKRRIRELERTIRARRQSDASQTRSESVSTTASFSVGHRNSMSASGANAGIHGRGREGIRDAEDDAVRVGESARGGGLTR